MQTALAVSQAKYWHLRHVGLFSTLSDRELRQLAQISDLRLVKRGQDLYRAGDLSDLLFVIRTGAVKLHKEGGDGRELILSLVGPGDLFGETAVTGEACRSDSATVMEDAFVCFIDRDSFTDYLMGHPELALRITQVIARRKIQVEERLMDLMFKDVKTRLAEALVQLAEAYGREDDDAPGLRIDIRMTQTDLGQLVGSTRETTSMAFNGFRRDGLVDSRDRVIWVLDKEALARR